MQAASHSSQPCRHLPRCGAFRRVLSLLIVAGACHVNVLLAEELGTRVPLIDKGISTYYVEGHIDGAGVVDMLVDTGAGYTAINEVTLEKLKRNGLAEHVRDLMATMANGKSARVPVYRISRLNIGGECELHNIEAVVLPGATRCILGLGTLKKVSPFMMSMAPTPSLSLSHCKKSLAQQSVGGLQ